MKYKQCPVCGKYNKHTRQNCVCGADISAVFDLVNMSEEEAEKANEKALPPVQEEIKAEPPHPGFIVCPDCGENNPWGEISCSSCGALLDDGLSSKAEAAQEEKGEAKQASPALTFYVVYEGSSYPFLAETEEKTFGRKSIPSPSFSEDRYISRNHFSYRYEEGRLLIKDISSNGTLLNGIPLEKGKEAIAKDGDSLCLYRRLILIKYAG